MSLLRDIDRDEFRRRLNDDVLSGTSISFNKINFVPRQEIQRMIEIECAVKAKRVVDKRPAP
ncbi:MAG: hypothetical protein HZA72_02095 [Candidatus Omnitrophica bacterium]|nr:hypothetical protein [Candidatus Omnitrophota bacterium]